MSDILILFKIKNIPAKVDLMRFRIIFAVAISVLFFSSIFPKIIKAQTRPNPKLKIEIPKLVARVNGVDIESKYIKFRLSKIERTVNRPLTVKEKTSIIKDLIEKEVVRELVSQQGKKENLKVDNKLIEKELESLEAAYSSEVECKNALKARNISIEDIKSSEINIQKRTQTVANPIRSEFDQKRTRSVAN